MAITLVNYDDTTNILLLLCNPPDFIVIILITKKFNLILKAFNLLCLGRLVILKLLQSFLSQSAFPFQLSSKITQLIEREGFAEVKPILIVIVICLLR